MARKLKVLMIMCYGHPPLPDSSFNINVMLIASYDVSSSSSFFLQRHFGLVRAFVRHIGVQLVFLADQEAHYYYGAGHYELLLLWCETL